MPKDQISESRRLEEEQAVQTALSWLEERYHDEIDEAIYFDFLGEPDEERSAAFDGLFSRIGDTIVINTGEWLLTEAELDIDGKRIKAHDLVLGTGGPLLTAHGREWLQELARRPLSLYEVRDVIKGEGLILADMLHPDQPPVEVKEKTASNILVPWDTFGARLLRRNGIFVMSGAVYPMDRQMALSCCEEIASELDFDEDDPEVVREITTGAIIDYWLDRLLEPRPMPQIVDASTGEKILLTTDHYRVTDWTELERILATQDDVQGDRNEGWDRLVKLGDGRFRLRASLTPKGPDGLEVFCRTPQLADQSREWLEEIAGGVVRYTIRAVTDPRSEKARNTSQSRPEPDIPQDVQREVIHQYLANHYETWPEIPLPALEGKSALEAVKNKRLRPAVIELLKSIDQLEARRIQQLGGEPFDVTFLWKRLGLERE